MNTTADHDLAILQARRDRLAGELRQATDRLVSARHAANPTRTLYQARHADLVDIVYERFADGDITFTDSTETAILIPIDEAVATTIDLLTDGDNYQFFNRCPACSCGSSGDANRSDCACYCHDPDRGLDVWLDRIADLETVLADLLHTVNHSPVIHLPTALIGPADRAAAVLHATDPARA